MNKILLKILFFWQKPKIAVVTAGNLELVRKFIFRVLGNPVLLEKKVLITNYREQFLPGKKKFLVLDWDDENIRRIGRPDSVKVLTFGFRADADFRASDVRINGGINFKINYQGNIVPVWLENFSGQEHIHAALAAAAVGEILDLNLVEVSEALRDLQ